MMRHKISHYLKSQGPQSPPIGNFHRLFDLCLELGVLKSIAGSMHYSRDSRVLPSLERIASYLETRGRIHDTVLVHLSYFCCPYPVFPKPTQLG